jgi:hypothetical protein
MDQAYEAMLDDQWSKAEARMRATFLEAASNKAAVVAKLLGAFVTGCTHAGKPLLGRIVGWKALKAHRELRLHEDDHARPELDFRVCRVKNCTRVFTSMSGLVSHYETDHPKQFQDLHEELAEYSRGEFVSSDQLCTLSSSIAFMLHFNCVPFKMLKFAEAFPDFFAAMGRYLSASPAMKATRLIQTSLHLPSTGPSRNLPPCGPGRRGYLVETYAAVHEAFIRNRFINMGTTALYNRVVCGNNLCEHGVGDWEGHHTGLVELDHSYDPRLRRLTVYRTTAVPARCQDCGNVGHRQTEAIMQRRNIFALQGDLPLRHLPSTIYDDRMWSAQVSGVVVEDGSHTRCLVVRIGDDKRPYWSYPGTLGRAADVPRAAHVRLICVRMIDYDDEADKPTREPTAGPPRSGRMPRPPSAPAEWTTASPIGSLVAPGTGAIRTWLECRLRDASDVASYSVSVDTRAAVEAALWAEHNEEHDDHSYSARSSQDPIAGAHAVAARQQGIRNAVRQSTDDPHGNAERAATELRREEHAPHRHAERAFAKRAEDVAHELEEAAARQQPDAEKQARREETAMRETLEKRERAHSRLSAWRR